MKCLVVGEKPSQVKRFTSALCDSVKSTKHSKYIYHYEGRWINSRGTIHQFLFLPLVGHITNIDTAEGYGWNECPPIQIVHDPKALVIKRKRGYIGVLNKLVKQVDQLWLALDPDAEGDNIALEVVNILRKEVNRRNIPLLRIWNSSLTKEEIERSFENPKPWNDLLALGVQGRRMIDAWLGFAGTREVTRAARQVLKVKVFSIGRVQLPTLYFIVHRDINHEIFVPTDRWKLNVELLRGRDGFIAEHERGFFDKKNDITTILNQLSGCKTAIVGGIEEKHVSKKPPSPLNTTAAVALLSRIMGINAKLALDLMANLYNKGLISYPRTENDRFQDNFPHRTIINKLAKYKTFIPFLNKLRQDHQVVVNGKRKGKLEDHDPIHPTGELNGLNALDKQEFRVWDILSRYYISMFMGDIKTDLTKLRLIIDNQGFIAEGVTITEIGWKQIHNWGKMKDKYLPKVKLGELLDIVRFKITKHPTTAPNRLTDSSLLKAMEKARIGTKSSRPDILQKLENRNYVRREKRHLISTDLGRVLIASLSPIWDDVVTPKYTAHVEQEMDAVSEGRIPYTIMLENLRIEYLELHKLLIVNLSRFKLMLKELNYSTQKQKVRDKNPKILKLLADEVLKLHDVEIEEEN